MPGSEIRHGRVALPLLAMHTAAGCAPICGGWVGKQRTVAGRACACTARVTVSCHPKSLVRSLDRHLALSHVIPDKSVARQGRRDFLGEADVHSLTVLLPVVAVEVVLGQCNLPSVVWAEAACGGMGLGWWNEKPD